MRLLCHCRCWIEISLGRLTFRNSIVHSRLLPQLNTNPQLITNPTSQNGILTLEQPPDRRSSHPTRFRNPARRNRQHRCGVLYHTPKGHSKHWLRESLDQPLSVRKIRLHLPVHGLANLHQSATGLLLRLRPKYQRSKSLGFGMCARVVDAVTVHCCRSGGISQKLVGLRNKAAHTMEAALHPLSSRAHKPAARFSLMS